MEHYARMTEKGVAVDAPKVTTQEQRKAILNAVIENWLRRLTLTGSNQTFVLILIAK